MLCPKNVPVKLPCKGAAQPARSYDVSFTTLSHLSPRKLYLLLSYREILLAHITYPGTVKTANSQIPYDKKPWTTPP